MRFFAASTRFYLFGLVLVASKRCSHRLGGVHTRPPPPRILCATPKSLPRWLCFTSFGLLASRSRASTAISQLSRFGAASNGLRMLWALDASPGSCQSRLGGAAQEFGLLRFGSFCS